MAGCAVSIRANLLTLHESSGPEERDNHVGTIDLVERLAQHKTLGSAPRKELEWLAEQGFLRLLETGDILSRKGQPVEGMYVIFQGRLVLYIDRGAGPVKLTEFGTGDVTGMLPYSRLVSPPGHSIAQEPVELLELHRDRIKDLIMHCHAITSILVHQMLDRTRLFTSTELQNEKMISLGKLSAGLAHELNNPASAIERSVSVLTDRLEESEDATLALGMARLSEAQLDAIEAIRERCLAKRATSRTPLEQIDREDAIGEWLTAHGLPATNAHTLADTEVTFDELNAVAAVVHGPALSAALRWAASACAVRGLATEIRGASMRISGLIHAVKGFTHMDQAMMADSVDVYWGLCNAVTVLQAKATEKSVAVRMDIQDALPPVMGFAAELNQIWGNLIDNALDAAPQGGCVEVYATTQGRRVLVRIVDNGAGIPAEIQSKIFDPFFTTKPQGQGTGLGLDIARRLVRHNEGIIEFDSIPGKTEFRVLLPVQKMDVSEVSATA